MVDHPVPLDERTLHMARDGKPSRDFFNYIKRQSDWAKNPSVGSLDSAGDITAPGFRAGNGRPWWDAKEKPISARGDGDADDFDRLQSGIDRAISSNSNLYIPGGIYYLTQELVNDGYADIWGDGMNRTVLSAGQFAGNSVYNDIRVMRQTGNCQNTTLSNMSLRGKGGWQDTGSFGASLPTLEVNGGENTFRKLRVDGGAQNIDQFGYDHLFDDLVISSAYAELLRAWESGNFFRRIKADSGLTTNSPNQNWPARINSHNYNVGDLVKNNDGSTECILYCIQGGLSGGSPPTNLNYGLPITDGAAVWYMSAPVGLYGIHVLTNGSNGSEQHFTHIDLSGDFMKSIYMDDQVGNDLSIATFHQTICSAQIDVSNTQWASFAQCEMPTMMQTSNKDVTITGCKSQGGLVVSGTFTGAGNINIT